MHSPMLIGERKRDREDSFEKHVSSTSRLSGAQVQKTQTLRTQIGAWRSRLCNKYWKISVSELRVGGLGFTGMLWS